MAIFSLVSQVEALESKLLNLRLAKIGAWGRIDTANVPAALCPLLALHNKNGFNMFQPCIHFPGASSTASRSMGKHGKKYVKPSCLLITWSHIPIYILGVGQIHGTVKSDVETQISMNFHHHSPAWNRESIPSTMIYGDVVASLWFTTQIDPNGGSMDPKWSQKGNC
jgi:hypothetical protein